MVNDLSPERKQEIMMFYLESIYAKALNDVNCWNGGAAVGMKVFQDRGYARRLVKDLHPLLYPEFSNRIDVHRLKLVQPYFDEVVSGVKTFEVRVNDRDYRVGDVLELLEYDQETNWLTDRSVRVRVTYILDNPRYVLPGMVIMAIKLEGGITDATE